MALEIGGQYFVVAAYTSAVTIYLIVVVAFAPVTEVQCAVKHNLKPQNNTEFVRWTLAVLFNNVQIFHYIADSTDYVDYFEPLDAFDLM